MYCIRNCGWLRDDRLVIPLSNKCGTMSHFWFLLQHLNLVYFRHLNTYIGAIFHEVYCWKLILHTWHLTTLTKCIFMLNPDDGNETWSNFDKTRELLKSPGRSLFWGYGFSMQIIIRNSAHVVYWFISAGSSEKRRLSLIATPYLSKCLFSSLIFKIC